MRGHVSKGFVRLARFAGAISVFVLALAGSAYGQQNQQQFLIDCVDPITPPYTSTFPSFATYIQQIGPIGTVNVKGPCNENVNIWGADNFTIIGPAVINGNVSIGFSYDAVNLRNMTITGSGGDGVDISGSKVSFDSCNVSNNAGNGISIDNASHVVIVGNGTFNNNGGWAGGIHLSGRSFLNIASSGQVQIQGNTQSGIWATQSDVQTTGNTIISGNQNGPGIYLVGGSRAQIGNGTGAPNAIQNNPNGGIQVLENSELSLWVCCSNAVNTVNKNGKFGISAGLHSQVTLAGADVSNNAGPGVDVYAGSQVDFFPGSQNRVAFNINPASAVTPGIRVTGNSEAWLVGAASLTNEISNNAGPGIQVLVNSSVDFANLTMVGNTSPARCDFTSTVASDTHLAFTTGCITTTLPTP